MGVWCSVTIDYKLDRSKHFSVRKAIEEFLAGHDYSLRVEARQAVIVICNDGWAAAEMINSLVVDVLRPNLFHVSVTAEIIW